MATIRLNAHMRQELTKSMMRHRFVSEIDALWDDWAALAIDVRNDVYTEAERELMEDLPRGWLDTRQSIVVKFDNVGVVNLYYNGARHLPYYLVRRDPVEMRSPDKDMHSCLKVYESKHPLAVRAEALERRTHALTQAMEAARANLVAVIEQVTTLNKLKTVWPEVAPFCKPWEGQTPNLPAINTAKLNDMLNLPVDEEAA